MESTENLARPMSRRERTELCNAALELGPDAPTLSGEWTVKDLVIHLLIRERDLLGAPGILLPQLAGLTESATRRLEEEDFTMLVERVRSGPPFWSPLSLGPVDRAFNTLEYFVHHEDIRRAQPGWTPRELTGREQGALWKSISFAGKALARPAGVPLEIRWPGGVCGNPSERVAVLRKGSAGDRVGLCGAPSEIALFLFGRDQTDGLTFEGPDAAVERLKNARLGF